MKVKLNSERFKARTPLCVRKRNGILYFQTQIEIAGNNGLRLGTYCEYSKISSDRNELEIGLTALNLIRRFNDLSDMTEDEFFALKGMSVEKYNEIKDAEKLNFMDAVDFKDLELNYEECFIKYTVVSKKYEFYISWFKKSGRQRNKFYSKSTGQDDNLIFDRALEFEDSISVEKLGSMITEAFDRGERMADKAAGVYKPSKIIELTADSFLEVAAPKDNHFVDYEDGDSGEIYQLFSYLPKENSAAAAYFALTCAPEMYCEVSIESIRSAWIETYGESEEIEVKELEYGIYRFRAEIKNNNVYRIAYFTDCYDDILLECCMEIPNPAKKKKLVDALPPLFEQFAFRCRKKP
ncbi:MAG: hypothetical protein PUE12_06805 [Oscillospiraceae bacterium]|nr:hypothetical protein [Oscillospiraceae bacterium]